MFNKKFKIFFLCLENFLIFVDPLFTKWAFFVQFKYFFGTVDAATNMATRNQHTIILFFITNATYFIFRFLNFGVVFNFIFTSFVFVLVQRENGSRSTFFLLELYLKNKQRIEIWTTRENIISRSR